MKTQVVHIEADDWVWVFIDGQLYSSGHSIHINEYMATLSQLSPFDFFYTYIDDPLRAEWLDLRPTIENVFETLTEEELDSLLYAIDH